MVVETFLDDPFTSWYCRDPLLPLWSLIRVGRVPQIGMSERGELCTSNYTGSSFVKTDLI